MMQRNFFFSSLVALLCAMLPCEAWGQERDLLMPNFGQLSSAHVRVLFQDSEGYMWYGMKSDGLYRDDGYSLMSVRADFLHPEVQINNNITAICEDSRNRLWIGTKRGLYILDKTDYSVRPTGDNTLQIWTFDALKASMGDSVWAYANKHVLVYDSEGRCVSQQPVDKNPLTTQNRKEVTDKRGNFWHIDDNGVPFVTINPVMELEEVDITKQPLCFNVPNERSGMTEEHKIHSVWAMSDSTKLVSTSLGMWMVRGGQKDAEPEQVGPNFGVVNTSSPGEDGLIYMNTEWQGLISYKDGRIEKLDSTIRNAYDIFYDDGRLWICTSDGRLLQYDVKKKEKMDMSEVCCLEGDAPIGIVVLNSKVWLLFNQRLLIFTPYRDPKAKPVIRYVFPSDLDPRPMFFRRLYSDGVNRIFVECEDKCFELKMKEEFLRKKPAAKIALSSYQTIHGVKYPGMDTHELNLQPDERVVHLFFTTFDHMNTQHVRFAYRYQGEQNWNYLEMGKNDVHLTRISGGSQTIEVIATNMDGQWVEQVFTLTLNREPYWWETVWAYIAYAVVALLLLGFSFSVGRRMERR